MNKGTKLIAALAISAFFLLAGGGIFYHYVIFLPNLEKQEQARAENLRQEEALQRKTQHEKCVNDADAHYEEMWKANCEYFPEVASGGCLVKRTTTVSLKENLYKEKQLCEAESNPQANSTYAVQ
jgi:hypothetical protein